MSRAFNSGSGNEPRADFENSRTALSKNAENQPSLKLITLNAVDSSPMFFRIIGEVQNISNEKLNGVSAVATVYDKNKQIIATDSFTIEYDPIMPNQVSPFTCVIKKNPLMDSYKVSFKTYKGELETLDGQTVNKQNRKGK